MAAEINWHRYGTKLRNRHAMNTRILDSGRTAIPQASCCVLHGRQCQGSGARTRSLTQYVILSCVQDTQK